MALLGIDAYPLTWPQGWKRTQWKKDSKFKTSFAVARDQMFRELKLMGVENNYHNTKVILSTNIPLRRDGLPLAGQSNPKDPGVACYFILRGKNMVFACDTYNKVEENLHAISKTIEAMRGIERWGASDLMERAFTGFAALPSPTKNKPWWEVLQVKPHVSREFITDAYRFLARKHHPDIGGDPEIMAELNRAYDEALKSRSS